MSYKNSVKLLVSNFSIVWKQLLYMLLLSLLVFGISYGTSTPIFETLKNEGVTSEFASIFENIYTKPSEVVTTVSSAFINLYNTIVSNFAELWLSILGTLITLIFAFNLLKQASMYNLSSLMYMQMTSYLSLGYTRNFISSLGQCIRFAFAKVVMKIPFAIIKALILYAYFHLVNSSFGIIIGLFVVAFFLILISALELVIFAGMPCSMLEVSGATSAFRAFFSGAKQIFKNFFRVFSNAVIVVLTIILVNLFLGLFTVGVGLLISIPATMLFLAIFDIACYLGVKGERYYLSENVIANPVSSEDMKVK